MKTETRYFRAIVRKVGTDRELFSKDFECVIPMTGSYHKMMDHAFEAIEAQGYQVDTINSHSSKRDCL